MLWIIHREYRPETKSLRASILPEHRAHMERHQPVLLFAGALESDEGTEDLGNTIVIQMDRREDVEAFHADDPYTRADVFADVRVRRIRRGKLQFGAMHAA